MQIIKKTVLPVLLSTIWISLSEFLRNEFILKNYWVDHYRSLGLEFASEPINGMVWGLWSLTFSIVLFILLKRFNLKESFVLGWTIGFVLMWLVVGNMQVLPFELLYFAIPASLLEVIVALLIIKKITKAGVSGKS
ncbi:hypothetical protein [Parvicella tangerina]|uniref:Uncharacterized protein n=1 Tax=Parvicella tangerina TaxID=2829795 RepID=A0A916JMV0_9FLAO|nr:hypothetical protein [Parvicella tangerina]CAG5081055.1 hypothetical protein CRYO30217_01525 [Parvicella tangerina]